MRTEPLSRPWFRDSSSIAVILILPLLSSALWSWEDILIPSFVPNYWMTLRHLVLSNPFWWIWTGLGTLLTVSIWRSPDLENKWKYTLTVFLAAATISPATVMLGNNYELIVTIPLILAILLQEQPIEGLRTPSVIGPVLSLAVIGAVILLARGRIAEHPILPTREGNKEGAQ